MILGAVQTKLQQTCVPPFRIVEDAAAFSAIKNPPQSNAAFVVPVSEAAKEPVRMTGVTRQFVMVSFSVVIFMRQYGDTKGGAKIKSIQDLRALVSSALLGWETGDYTPISFVKGDLMQLEGAGMWWLDEYQTSITVSY